MEYEKRTIGLVKKFFVREVVVKSKFVSICAVAAMLLNENSYAMKNNSTE